MARRITLLEFVHAPRRWRTRGRVLACALSLIAVGAMLPHEFTFAPPAQAQQNFSDATEALFLAIERNDLQAVQQAITDGANIEARDFTGSQPVDLAIERGYSAIARYLISVRNAQNKDATSPAQQPQTAKAADTGGGNDLFAGLSNEIGASTGDETPAQTPPPAPAPEPEAEAEPLATPEPVTDPAPAQVAEVDEPPSAPANDPFSDFTDHGVVSTDEDAPAPGESATVAAPFDSPAPSTELPVVGDVQDPMTPTATPETDPEPEIALEIAPEPETDRDQIIEPDPETAVQIGADDVAAASSDGDGEDLQLTTDEPSATAKALDGDIPAPPPEKASAAKRFFTTFLDFFKPPNTTGVIRRERVVEEDEDALSDEELARQLNEIDAERGDAPIRGPEVPITAEELEKELPPVPILPDDLAREMAERPQLTSEGDTETAALPQDDLPPYPIGAPDQSAPLPPQQDVFSDIAVEEVTEEENIYEGAIPEKPDFREAPGVPGKKYDPTKPFGGGVDPEVLAYLGLDERTGRDDGTAFKPKEADHNQTAASDDPFSGMESEDGGDPFALVENDKDTKVSELLDGLDSPQDVAELDAKRPPSRAAQDDPFAAAPETDPNDPFAAQPAGDPNDPFAAPTEEVDELAGLLEGIGEQVDGTQGWDVDQVEGSDMPTQVVALSEIEPTGEVLDGVELALGMDTSVGREVGELRMKLMEQETIHKPCLMKGGPETMFCIDTLSWPFELEEDFLVDTIMYQGTRAIARYDAGHATHFHTLFRSHSFEKIISYYTQRYGKPTEVLSRSIAPLAAPRQDNPTYIWQSREPGTDTITTLEIRKFNDAEGGGFPDTERGVILLYRNHAKPIFPQLSQLELMVLKPDDVGLTAPEANERDNTNIWN